MNSESRLGAPNFLARLFGGRVQRPKAIRGEQMTTDAASGNNGGGTPADFPNIIKVRDDKAPLRFGTNGSGQFHFDSSAEPSWVEKTQPLTEKDLRGRIEPWLTSLVQSEHLSLLVGSGLTHAVHYMAVGGAATGMGAKEFNHYNDKIGATAKKIAERAGRSEGNFEDQLRVANELVRGLEIVGDDRATELQKEIDDVLEAFAKSILEGEANIAKADQDQREHAFNTLVTFLMSFASRSGTRDRLSLFTTNYDRLLEAGAEIAGLHLLDRFVGNLFPIFRSSRLDIDMHYNPPGIRGEPRYLEGVARYTKLHGSVDWVQMDRDVRRLGVPFGATEVAPYLKAPGFGDPTTGRLMIYPNSAKDIETSEFPFVDLFRDFSAAVCRPNSTLVTYGYSFGDEHINRVVRDMLTIPSTHVVIIAFDDEPLHRIMKTYEQLGRHSQISLMIGPELGDLTKLTENYLPKPAIDKASYRMSELLRQRVGMEKARHKASEGHPVEEASS